MGVFLIATMMALARIDAPDAIPTRPPALRPISNIIRTITEEAIRRSPTIAALASQLRQYDIIVYIDLSGVIRDRGATTIIAAPGSWRILRVLISDRLDPGTRMEVIGHELCHALEIARAPEVRDVETFRAFYGRVGFPVADNAWETIAARDAETQVRRELSRAVW